MRSRKRLSSLTFGGLVSRDFGKVLAARNIPAAPSRSTKCASDFEHLSSGRSTGSSCGGATSPLFRNFLMLPQASHFMKGPKGPFSITIGLPQRSQGMVKSLAPPGTLNSPCSITVPSQSGLLPQM